MKRDRQPQQTALITFAGFLGAIVAFMALIIIMARWSLPFLMGGRPPS